MSLREGLASAGTKLALNYPLLYDQWTEIKNPIQKDQIISKKLHYLPEQQQQN